MDNQEELTQNELMADRESYMTLREFADDNDLAISTVRAYACTKRIPTKRIGGVVLVHRDYVYSPNKKGQENLSGNLKFLDYRENGYIPISDYAKLNNKSEMQVRVHYKKGRFKDIILVNNRYILIHESEPWPENLLRQKAEERKANNNNNTLEKIPDSNIKFRATTIEKKERSNAETFIPAKRPFSEEELRILREIQNRERGIFPVKSANLTVNRTRTATAQKFPETPGTLRIILKKSGNADLT